MKTVGHRFRSQLRIANIHRFQNKLTIHVSKSSCHVDCQRGGECSQFFFFYPLIRVSGWGVQTEIACIVAQTWTFDVSRGSYSHYMRSHLFIVVSKLWWVGGATIELKRAHAGVHVCARNIKACA